jgi:hypothetical protein
MEKSNNIRYWVETLPKMGKNVFTLEEVVQQFLENPVQIDPVNQTNLTPYSKIRLTLLTKVKMTPLKYMPT